MPASTFPILASCCLASVIATTAGAGEINPWVPDPISTSELVSWFGPLLGQPQGAWEKALHAHAEYLHAQFRLHDEEIAPWATRLPDGEDAATIRSPERERQRRRLVERVEALDGQLFDALAAVVAPDVQPVVEWLRTHRRIETCECGLDAQTAEVSFSLLSYSEVALIYPPVVWTSPQAALPLAEYDRKVLDFGRKYVRARLAWLKSQAAQQGNAEGPADAEASHGAPDIESDGPDEDHQDGSGDEPIWQAHGATLATMGRQSHARIEASLDPSARLVYRLHILLQAADLSGAVADSPEEPVDFRSRRRAAAPLLHAVTELRFLLAQAIDPLVTLPLDMAAIDLAAAGLWAQAQADFDVVLRASRRRSDVMFGLRADLTESDAAALERTRLEAVKRLYPVMTDGLARIAAIFAEARDLEQTVAAATVWRPQPLPELDMASERDRPGQPDQPDWGDLLDLDGLDDTGSFDAEAFANQLHGILQPPLATGTILRSLGWVPPDPAGPNPAPPNPASPEPAVPAERHRREQDELPTLVATIRADALSRVWNAIAPIVASWNDATDNLDSKGELDGVIANLLSIRRSIGEAEEAMIDQIGSIVPDDEGQRRLGLLRLSTRVLRCQWPLEHAPEMTMPLVRPIDPAGLLLQWIGERPVEPSSPEASAIEALLRRSDEVLGAAARTSAAFLDLGRTSMLKHLAEDDLEEQQQARRLAAAQREMADAVQGEIRLQRQMLEDLLAVLGAEDARRLAAAHLRASVTGDLALTAELDRAVIQDLARWAEAAEDEALARRIELAMELETARRGRLDAVLDSMVEAVLEHGSVFPDDWEVQPRSHRLLNGRLNRLRFEAGEISARADIALGATLPPGPSPHRPPAMLDLIGRAIGPDGDVMAIMLHGTRDGAGP